jgi:predicted nucleic acid-binding protein
MPSYYFDTSALAKRYVAEVGSSWVQDICAQQSGQTIYTSVLTQPEIVSALQRRMREGIFEAYLLRLALIARSARNGTPSLAHNH